MPIKFLAAALALIAFLPAAVIAGGEDYDAAMDKEGAGPAYFGFIRDNRGQAVPAARVTLRPKGGGAPVEVQSNAVGLYRTHVRKEVKPDDVEVSCAKAGYRQTRVSRRTPPGSTAMFIETDCVLQRQ